MVCTLSQWASILKIYWNHLLQELLKCFQDEIVKRSKEQNTNIEELESETNSYR